MCVYIVSKNVVTKSTNCFKKLCVYEWYLCISVYRNKQNKKNYETKFFLDILQMPINSQSEKKTGMVCAINIFFSLSYFLLSIPKIFIYVLSHWTGLECINDIVFCLNYYPSWTKKKKKPMTVSAIARGYYKPVTWHFCQIYQNFPAEEYLFSSFISYCTPEPKALGRCN